MKGPDAASFLQNIFTNDIDKLSEAAPLQYSLLLSPQGQVLQEIFILRRSSDAYFIDVWQDRKADLVRRLQMFRLRAKVDITDTNIKVYAGQQAEGFDDPRAKTLGMRLYSEEARSAQPDTAYKDFCILQGIATPAAIRFEKDFTHDLGLQKLNAIAWDKGCFIGQEVAARVEHRGLAKKELCVVEGSDVLQAGPITLADGAEVGELRDITSDGRQGLAIIKKIAMENSDLLGIGGVKIAVLSSFG